MTEKNVHKREKTNLCVHYLGHYKRHATLHQ